MGTGLFGGIVFGQYSESLEMSPFKAGVYGSPIARANMMAARVASVSRSTRAVTTTRSVSIDVEISSERGQKILK